MCWVATQISMYSKYMETLKTWFFSFPIYYFLSVFIKVNWFFHFTMANGECNKILFSALQNIWCLMDYEFPPLTYVCYFINVLLVHSYVLVFSHFTKGIKNKGFPYFFFFTIFFWIHQGFSTFLEYKEIRFITE